MPNALSIADKRRAIALRHRYSQIDRELAAAALGNRLPDWSPHEAQLRVLDSRARFRIVCAGRRFGKTVLASHLAVSEALRGVPGWWVAPTYPLAQVGWREIRRLCRRIPGTHVSLSEKRVTLPGGGWVQVRSAGNEGSLRGEGLGFVVIDEGAQLPDGVWAEEIRPALADRQGWALWIGSPQGKGNDFARLYDAAEHDPVWERFRFPTWENPHIHPDEIEALRRDLAPGIFAQEVEAQIIDDYGGLSLIAWERCKAETDIRWRIAQALGEKDDRPVVLAVDAAMSDDHMALVGVRHGRWDETEGIYIPECCYVHEWVTIPGQPHDPAQVRQEIVRLRDQAGMNIAGVTYDPYQFHESALQLSRQGFFVLAFDQGKPRAEADSMLVAKVQAGNFMHYGDASLTQAWQNATVHHASQGERREMRFVKRTQSAKIDLLVALSMAVHTLMRTPVTPLRVAA